MAVVTPKLIVVANVGDSRAVLGRRAEGVEAAGGVGGAEASSSGSISAMEHAAALALVAKPLSRDHKFDPDLLPEECSRAIQAGAW